MNNGLSSELNWIVYCSRYLVKKQQEQGNRFSFSSSHLFIINLSLFEALLRRDRTKETYVQILLCLFHCFRHFRLLYNFSLTKTFYWCINVPLDIDCFSSVSASAFLQPESCARLGINNSHILHVVSDNISRLPPSPHPQTTFYCRNAFVI